MYKSKKVDRKEVNRILEYDSSLFSLVEYSFNKHTPTTVETMSFKSKNSKFKNLINK